MSQLTRTYRGVRVALLPIVFVFAIAVAATAGFVVGSNLDKTSQAAPAKPASVTADAVYPPGSSLNSEYLIEISRDWGKVPMTAQQARVVSQLNSEYLLQASIAWFTPMTHNQARIRANLNSEYLREAALGW